MLMSSGSSTAAKTSMLYSAPKTTSAPPNPYAGSLSGSTGAQTGAPPQPGSQQLLIQYDMIGLPPNRLQAQQLFPGTTGGGSFYPPPGTGNPTSPLQQPANAMQPPLPITGAQQPYQQPGFSNQNPLNLQSLQVRGNIFTFVEVFLMVLE